MSARSSILAGQDRISLGDGLDLRLLSALEVLQARREAAGLAGEGQERALCSNACLLARALELSEGHTPVFDSGRAVLAGLTAEEIQALAGRWSAFRRESDPGLELSQEGLEEMEESLRSDPGERLRWRVLRQAHALPTEERARAMKGRDYLWCLVNTLLDREEELARLCPACRAWAAEERCPVCGGRTGEVQGAVNPAFDLVRFQELKEGDSG